MTAHVYQSAPSGKPKGGVRKFFGILLCLFAVLPLLGAALTVYKAIQNAQDRNSNDAFVPKAWHNLRSDELFPDRLVHQSADSDVQLWARQGISCKEAFPAGYADNVMADSCKLVLRATYIDPGGDMAATIGLVVAKSPAQATEIESEINEDQSEGLRETRVPTVRPFAVSGTAAAGWSDGMAFGGASKQIFIPDSPYTVAVTVGPTDSARAVGQLPDPWDFLGYQEKYPYRDVAKTLAHSYADDLRKTVLGK
jgi:hypothetical protein